MERWLTILVVSGVAMLMLSAGFDLAHRTLSKKRKDYRMRQALRRGLADPDGVQARKQPRLIQWQSCDTSSVRFS